MLGYIKDILIAIYSNSITYNAISYELSTFNKKNELNRKYYFIFNDLFIVTTAHPIRQNFITSWQNIWRP